VNAWVIWRTDERDLAGLMDPTGARDSGAGFDPRRGRAFTLVG